jgi:hypothetical protein
VSEERPRGLRGLLGRINRGSVKIGTTETPTDPAEAEAAIDALGDAGHQARALDAAAERALGADAPQLSELTSELALAYLERIRHPLAALTMEQGVTLVTRGYAAHLAVEAGPAAYGAGREVPVIGTLPDPRRGRPPQDLLLRVVKATRRQFPSIRAVPDGVWEGFVVATSERVQAGHGDERVLDRSVIEGLLRFGWVLRQVDLRYQTGLEAG